MTQRGANGAPRAGMAGVRPAAAPRSGSVGRGRREIGRGFVEEIDLDLHSAAGGPRDRTNEAPGLADDRHLHARRAPDLRQLREESADIARVVADEVDIARQPVAEVGAAQGGPPPR
jgi:hypothetical protein